MKSWQRSWARQGTAVLLCERQGPERKFSPAMRTELMGVLAARSLLEGESYEVLWRRELEPAMWSAMVNRALFALLGNRGYRWILRRNQSQHWDAHHVLRKLCQPRPVKLLLAPWARSRYTSRRLRSPAAENIAAATAVERRPA